MQNENETVPRATKELNFFNSLFLIESCPYIIEVFGAMASPLEQIGFGQAIGVEFHIPSLVQV